MSLITRKCFAGGIEGVAGFSLNGPDAYDTAVNINAILMGSARWFQKPKPMPIEELRRRYKEYCPDMELRFPGVVDKMIQPEIVRQLGYLVDAKEMVSISFT